MIGVKEVEKRTDGGREVPFVVFLLRAMPHGDCAAQNDNTDPAKNLSGFEPTVRVMHAGEAKAALFITL